MVRRAKARVEQSSKVYSTVAVHLEAWTDDEGLVIEGQDLGPGVSSVWGDSDYEYRLSIDRTRLDHLLSDLARSLGPSLMCQRSPKRVTRYYLTLSKRLRREGFLKQTSTSAAG